MSSDAKSACDMSTDATTGDTEIDAMRDAGLATCLISTCAACGAIGIGIVRVPYTVRVRSDVHVVCVVQAP